MPPLSGQDDIFTAPLSELALPYLCELLAVVSGGPKHEGIFRIPGDKARMDKVLKEAHKKSGVINAGMFGTNSNDVAVAASLLKQYFRELSTGVICAPVLSSIFVASDMDNSPEKLAVFKSLLSYLPRINILCLTLLCRVMRLIVKHQDVNLMTSSNLASAGWAVTLLRDRDDAMMNLGRSLPTMTYIINNSSLLFEEELKQESLEGFTDRFVNHSIAEYDFEAEDHSCELSFQEGDTLFTKAPIDGWAEATLVGHRTSKSGLVPANYIKNAHTFTPHARGTPLESVGRLSLTIHCGRNLPVADLNGLSDPYILLLTGTNEKLGTTKAIKKTLNPDWEETFTLVLKRSQPHLADSSLLLRVMDLDLLSRDDRLGEYHCAFSTEVAQGDHREVELVGAKSGSLIISYLYEPF